MLEHADGDLACLRPVLVLDEDTVAPAVLTVDPLDGDGDLCPLHIHVVAVQEGEQEKELRNSDITQEEKGKGNESNNIRTQCITRGISFKREIQVLSNSKLLNAYKEGY